MISPATSASIAAPATDTMRPRLRVKNRPTRRATSSRQMPARARAARTHVSARTYQSRGTKKDGRKCWSSQRWVAAIATPTQATPTAAMASSIARERLPSRRRYKETVIVAIACGPPRREGREWRQRNEASMAKTIARIDRLMRPVHRWVWRDHDRRLRKLLAFADVETDGGRDILRAAEVTPDPLLRRLYLEHAIDELHHGDLFRDRGAALWRGRHSDRPGLHALFNGNPLPGGHGLDDLSIDG